ncbi:sensor histidine kinase [Pseudomonas sessilinigenes]|uniref:histidine kinase n=1 Tax=Pseudomonas sessilinigenes TaxID=658629 RepID=A0ABX8MLB5_9PSED|nr:PAS domain-containing protein [Pseudomonas sessilinigenes]AZC27067.1 diguanylate cyclase/phosphodiesterase [Pseudomonas sessilinigenes]QXH38981.1 PAS domain-containing protein [Pseudomonas sessilinigenes]
MRKDDNEVRVRRDGEPPVFDLQRAMLDATPDCIKVLAPDGTLLAMNASGCVALDIAPSKVKGSAWVPLLPPSIHSAAYDALALAATGLSARFAGYSDACGKVIYWDNLLTPTIDPAGRVHTIVCVSRDVTEQVLLQKELDQSLAREQLLSGEMVHRIKNLFTVAAAVILMADREARASGTTEPLAKIAAGKLRALSRAYSTVLAADDVAHVEMEAFMVSVLHPFGAQCRFSGTKNLVPGPLANVLALLLHELATNSVKHGALSVAEGEVELRWSVNDGWLAIRWLESGGPVIAEPPARYGYGSGLIDQLAGSVGGTLQRDWHRRGLQVELRVPFPAG